MWGFSPMRLWCMHSYCSTRSCTLDDVSRLHALLTRAIATGELAGLFWRRATLLKADTQARLGPCPTSSRTAVLRHEGPRPGQIEPSNDDTSKIVPACLVEGLQSSGHLAGSTLHEASLLRLLAESEVQEHMLLAHLNCHQSCMLLPCLLRCLSCYS